MIKKWRLDNFKAIGAFDAVRPVLVKREGKADKILDALEFGKLTVFTGANSSGKSTIIQSILLMMQTLANRGDVPLQLNGDLLSLGTVSDVWHNSQFEQADGSPILLRFQMTLSDIYDSKLNHYIEVYFYPLDTLDDIHVQTIGGNYAIGEGRNEKYYSRQMAVNWNPDWKCWFIESMSEALRAEIEAELIAKNLQDIAPFDHAEIQLEDYYPSAVKVEASITERGMNWETALTDPGSFADTAWNLGQKMDDQYWEILKDVAYEMGLRGLEGSWLLGRPRLIKTFAQYKEWFNKQPTGETDKLKIRLMQRLPGAVSRREAWYKIPFFEVLATNVNDVFTESIRYLSANRLEPTILFSRDIQSKWSDVGITGHNVARAIQDNINTRLRFFIILILNKSKKRLLSLMHLQYG